MRFSNGRCVDGRWQVLDEAGKPTLTSLKQPFFLFLYAQLYFVSS